MNDFLNGNAVLFAGSGISTENANVLKFSFYDTILTELGLDYDDEIEFPKLMEKFVDQPNGRIKLIGFIKERFDHIKSFPELYRTATRFHNEIATYYPLKTIITTNWDTYFEDECAAIPFITDEDLAFWNTDDRKVLKIHGSINNYGSLVATQTDYNACEERLHQNILGSILKTLLATKTIVFVGYSFKDTDFKNIFKFVSEQMSDFQRQAYVITPFEDESMRFEEIGLKPIITDGTYFFKQLKLHSINEGLLITDSIYDEADNLLSIVQLNHRLLFESYNIFDHPQIIFTGSYQDGLMHAFEKVIALKSKGVFSKPKSIEAIFNPYQKWKKEKLREKRYEDVAYIDGYLNAFYFLLAPNDLKKELVHPPLYYAFGITDKIIGTFENFDEIVSELPDLHKSSYKRATKMVNELESDNVEFHHPPWL